MAEEQKGQVVSNQSARTYNFKSVGDQQAEYAISNRPRINEIPIGIKTPMELGTKHDGIFAMHTDIALQIHDNFRNLLLTNHGDRLGRCDFGANLTELAHELGSEDTDAEAISRIKKATSKYLPFIQLKTFTAFVDHHDNAHTSKCGLQITYDVSALAIENKAIEIVIYSTG